MARPSPRPLRRWRRDLYRSRVPHPSHPRAVFDEIRDAFRELLRGNPTPDARRSILGDMRETLVRAKMGLDDLRQLAAQVNPRGDDRQHA
mgnify:CR=1 FL=1